MATEREQKLVELCFSLVLHYRTFRNEGVFDDTQSMEELAEWVRYNLKECGFPTIPVGSNWGRLTD